MKPTVGRIVHYVLPFAPFRGEIRAAVIVRVWNDTCVNVRVFTDGPDDLAAERQTRVCQTDETARVPGCWFWPPRS